LKVAPPQIRTTEVKPGYGKLSRLKLRFCLFCDLSECARVLHGKVGENLAINLDTGQFQSVDQLAVSRSVGPGSGVDLDIP